MLPHYLEELQAPSYIKKGIFVTVRQSFYVSSTNIALQGARRKISQGNRVPSGEISGEWLRLLLISEIPITILETAS